MIGALLYARKRGDRWWRFHVLRAAFVRAQQERGGNRVLSRAFRRLGYGPVPGDLEPFWDTLVAAGAGRQTRLTEEQIRAIESGAADLSPRLLPTGAWLDLFRLCIGTGFFQAARVLREKGLERAVLDAGVPGAGIKVLTSAVYPAIELGDHELARKLLADMERAGFKGARLLQARWLVELFSDGAMPPVPGFESSASPEDLEFGHLVRGRRVALVGPVASTRVQGAEIDNHDLVTKFGYRGGEKGRDPETQGARIDISYYNNAQAEMLSASDYHPVLSELRWGVCINRKGRSCFPDDCEQLRQIRSFQWLMPDTHLNAGPNAVIDLLRFGPDAVKIFNTDLMLSSGRFAGYKPEGDKPIDHTRAFIKTHDPILQYQVMRRLWGLGYIGGDPRFESVMTMGLRGYLDELQQAYGAVTRALF